MKLTLKRDGGHFDAFISLPTRLGDTPLVEWLAPQVDEYKKQGRQSQSYANFGYADLLAEADAQHATYSLWVRGKSGFTISILRIIEALGCEIHIVKKEKKNG